MLKTGKVYIYKNKIYFFVHSVKKEKRRNIYTVSKVSPSGSLGKREKIKFERGKFKEAKNYDVSIFVKFSESNKQRMHWQRLVTSGIEKKNDLQIITDKEEKDDVRRDIARLAIASIYYQNAETGENYDIRDYAKALGFKNYSTLYKWVEKYLKTLYTKEKYTKAIKEATDTTILTNYASLKAYWQGLHGFNKEVNKLLVMNLKAYHKEIRDRGLRI
jgi:hypothetical protein